MLGAQQQQSVGPLYKYDFFVLVEPGEEKLMM